MPCSVFADGCLGPNNKPLPKAPRHTLGLSISTSLMHSCKTYRPRLRIAHRNLSGNGSLMESRDPLRLLLTGKGTQESAKEKLTITSLRMAAARSIQSPFWTTSLGSWKNTRNCYSRGGSSLATPGDIGNPPTAFQPATVL